MEILLFLMVFALFGFIEAADYCLNTGPTSDLDTTLGAVSISGDKESGFTSDKYCGEGLRDLTGTHSVALVLNTAYTISWGGDSCGNQFYKQGRLWIDWNSAGWQNGGDAEGDALGQVVGAQAAFTENTQFTVPGTATEGFTRLRGMVIEDTDPSSLVPCHHFAFGGTTDFKVEIIGKSGGGSGGGGGGGGMYFVIALIVVVVLYCVGGFVFNLKKRGKTGAEAIPQIDFWKDFPVLVKEGCQFTFGKVKSLTGKKSGGYSTFEDV